MICATHQVETITTILAHTYSYSPGLQSELCTTGHVQLFLDFGEGRRQALNPFTNHDDLDILRGFKERGAFIGYPRTGTDDMEGVQATA